MKIIAMRGDITKVDVDAIVNPIDARQERPGKIGRALVKQGGRDVQDEAVARGPIGVGEAILTTGGKLKCKYVIHAPAGETAGAPDPESVKKSTLAALRCAAGSRLRSVAIPVAPAGESAARALVSAVRDFDQEGGLETVFIVGENGRMVSAVKKFIKTGN